MSELEDRMSTELELLASMYPDEFRYKGRELNYRTANGHLALRLPPDYLRNVMPDLVLASIGKEDVRDEMRQAISSYETGEEVLDAIILAFTDLVRQRSVQEGEARPENVIVGSTEKATIIVWLHHLLNTNKRKHCLSPPSGVSGITKPGYPGVLVYSGLAALVYEHVNELKQLNWAAFQIRFEKYEPWHFKHGNGVIEVEAMKDVVAELEDSKKDLFLESMRMK